MTWSEMVVKKEELNRSIDEQMMRELAGVVRMVTVTPWSMRPSAIHWPVNIVGDAHSGRVDERQSKPCAVLYVCFGSLSILSSEQLREVAQGLEAAGHPFVLVVRKSGDEWMPEGFEDRVKENGLVVRGWAPQIEILAHRATAGFMTHCGWNSNLEGICAGLPMLTWPLFAEQFYNERFLVDVLKVGVAVGSKEHVVILEKRKEVIGASDVEAAVRKFMAEGEEAKERRRRAKELAEMARKAVEEGGSSYNDMGRLLQDLTELRTRKVEVGQH
ncbi:hypothetical protein HPP92_000286 [Vanilla planifolia]|uniref:UDP-glycosyltransferases domain-containing protein n=1 Tax=Vanilla planifolia TaxID=51239 RepID=A0A835VGW1_VANPL|nr:hypothetical protein HPP92_000286 [Vanilla planifolia]